MVVTSETLASQRQLSALLQVVEQVARTSLVHLRAANIDLPWRPLNLTAVEQLSLEWLVEQVTVAKYAVIVADTWQLPDLTQFLTQEQMGQNGASNGGDRFRFYAGFPILQHLQGVGVLSVMAREPLTLSPDQQTAIATLAAHISYLLTAQPMPEVSHPVVNPIEKTLIQDPLPLTLSPSASSRLEHGYAAVMELSMALQECLSFEDLHQQLKTVLPTALSITAFEVWLFRKSVLPQQVCVWPADVAVPDDKDDKEQLYCQRPINSPHCLLEQQNVIYESRLPCSAHPVGDNGTLDRYSAWHCYPLKRKRKTIGTLKVCLSNTTHEYLWRDSDILSKMAEQVSITLHRLYLFQKLKSENLQDPLTTLFNRRYMINILSKLLQRVSYGHYQVGLILMDIDHFKHLNDTFGHDAGDQVLRVLGLFLKGHARPNDAICRYGGEEFVLILSDVNWEVLERRANQLCRSVRYLSLNAGGKSLSITLSAGFAIAPLQGKTPSTLIKAADTALYEAKRSGRDRAVGASCPDPVTE
jgi:diguanylate cyclase (GGDEF)-like protein